MNRKTNKSFRCKLKSHVRTKRVCSHPNPLFEKWLKEWKNQAEESGSKMKYSFQNAIKSLKKYPLPLYSGKDCLVLANFGIKICSIIDKKLEDHVKQFGPINWDDYIKVKDDGKVSTKIKRKRVRKSNNEQLTLDMNEDCPTKVLGNSKRYIPAFRSGAYALLLTLYEKSRSGDYKGYMTKQELIKSAQGLCDASFVTPPEGSHYTAWSSMSTLIRKKFVLKNGSPARYVLTKAGESLSCSLSLESLPASVSSSSSDLQNDRSSVVLPVSSEEICDQFTSPKCSSVNVFKDISRDSGDAQKNYLSDIGNDQIYKASRTEISLLKLGSKFSSPRKSTYFNEESSEDEDVAVTYQNFHQSSKELCHRHEPLTEALQSDILFSLYPNSFKIILNIDNTEVFGGSGRGQKCSKEIIKEYLEKSNIEFQVRNLNVGDFLWTCRKNGCDKEENEVVLPFIVERKRMDDLGRSIRDGRFKEQKFRLKRSGLTQLIYLVEEYGSTHSVTPIPTCEQAVTNTQIIDDFKIKVVKDQRESAVYLAIMTRYLQDKFQSKTIHCLNPESKFLSKENIANDSSFYFMNFKDLNSTSAKNRLLSIRDMFAKHLLQIFGASVDKVTSLIQKYPTPQTLITALECQSVENENYQISDIRCEKTGRMVDQTLLSQIAKLYTRETLL
ncbi:UNVERIFIED_CONTAM: hypothetical protein RMT77_015356 [Armadillidium vulgare]